MANQKRGKLAFLFFLIKWLFIVGFGLAFLPVTISVLLGWLVFKKVENKKLKIGLLVAIIIPTLSVGAGWIYAINQIILSLQV